MFSSKSTGKMDSKGSRGSFIMEKDFASGTIQVLTLVLKSPEVWVPQHLSRRSGKLQTSYHRHKPSTEHSHSISGNPRPVLHKLT